MARKNRRRKVGHAHIPDDWVSTISGFALPPPSKKRKSHTFGVVSSDKIDVTIKEIFGDSAYFCIGDHKD